MIKQSSNHHGVVCRLPAAFERQERRLRVPLQLCQRLHVLADGLRVGGGLTDRLAGAPALAVPAGITMALCQANRLAIHSHNKLQLMRGIRAATQGAAVSSIVNSGPRNSVAAGWRHRCNEHDKKQSAKSFGRTHFVPAAMCAASAGGKLRSSDSGATGWPSRVSTSASSAGSSYLQGDEYLNAVIKK